MAANGDRHTAAENPDGPPVHVPHDPRLGSPALPRRKAREGRGLSRNKPLIPAHEPFLPALHVPLACAT
jgi:hypothetical protein